MGTDAEVKFTKSLRNAFDEICKEADVYQGIGPPMAYFQTPGESPKRYIYFSFSMGGVKPEGQPGVTDLDPAKVLSASVSTFREWLKPKRTLAWRSRPEMGVNTDGRWASYWRCVQLDDDAKCMVIDWNF